MKTQILFCIFFCAQLLTAQVIMVNRPTQTFTISGLVFIDNNGDGQSVSDAGYAGAQINLYKSDGSYLATTFSDGSGLFSFSNRSNQYPECLTCIGCKSFFIVKANKLFREIPSPSFSSS